MPDYEQILDGVDGERVYVARPFSELWDGRPYQQLRPRFTPLQGVVSIIYSDGFYRQRGVADQWWDMLIELARGEPVDYFSRLQVLVARIEQDPNTYMLHEGRGNYITRFKQPFYPDGFGTDAKNHADLKPRIRDRAYLRFWFRRGQPPGLEEYTPDIVAENTRWREIQNKQRSG